MPTLKEQAENILKAFIGERIHLIETNNDLFSGSSLHLKIKDYPETLKSTYSWIKQSSIEYLSEPTEDELKDNDTETPEKRGRKYLTIFNARNNLASEIENCTNMIKDYSSLVLQTENEETGNLQTGKQEETLITSYNKLLDSFTNLMTTLDNLVEVGAEEIQEIVDDLSRPQNTPKKAEEHIKKALSNAKRFDGIANNSILNESDYVPEGFDASAPPLAFNNNIGGVDREKAETGEKDIPQEDKDDVQIVNDIIQEANDNGHEEKVNDPEEKDVHLEENDIDQEDEPDKESQIKTEGIIEASGEKLIVPPVPVIIHPKASGIIGAHAMTYKEFYTQKVKNFLAPDRKPLLEEFLGMDDQVTHAAKMMAAHNLAAQKGDNTPVNKTEFNEAVRAIRLTPAFRVLAANPKDLNLANTGRFSDLDKKMTAIRENFQDDLKDRHISALTDTLNKLTRRNHLSRVDAEKYVRSRSPEFIRMIKNIQNVIKASMNGQKVPDELKMKALASIFEYQKGKEKVRFWGGGKERFNLSMEAAMSLTEGTRAEAYVTTQINRVNAIRAKAKDEEMIEKNMITNAKLNAPLIHKAPDSHNIILRPF